MSDKEKLTAESAGAMGCLIGSVILYVGTPILLFLVLLMAFVRGCQRMFS